MTIWNRIEQRARGKSLYDLHPELTERVPILRVYSDTAEAGGPTSMAEYYTSNVWVHKAVKVLADNIADLDLRVVRDNNQEIEVLDNHPITTLLANPNKEIDPAQLWREWTINMMLIGEIGFEAVMSLSKTKVLELWPREAGHYNLSPGQGGRRYRRIDHYKIDDNEGPPYTLPPEQFIHFKFFNPLNAWRGLAPIYAARVGIAIDQLAQAWSRLFFRNQARPDFALIAPDGITPTEKEELYNRLETHGGGAGLHKPIILEEGVTDIKVFSYPPKDLEWIEQRKLSRDEIGAIFGVPDEIMGYGRDTYENFSAADGVLWTLTIVPVVGLRDHTLTRYFRRVKAIAANERIQTDLSQVPQLQEDKTEKVNQLNVLAGRGYPVNLVANWLGLDLPKINGGEVGYLPLNVFAATSEEGTPAPIQPEPAKAAVKSLLEFGSPQHEAAWKASQIRINPHVANMQRNVKREFQRQQNQILVALRNSRIYGRGKFKDPDLIPPPESVFNMEAEVKLFTEAFRNVITEAVMVIGETQFEDVKQFDVTRPEVQAGIRHILETVAIKTNNTTWNDLIAIFQEAELAGEGIVKMQERVNTYFGSRKSDWQTERIARTTMTGAANMASVEAWKQSEVVSKHTWLSALIPDRTRDSHKDAHGQTVKLGEMFNVGNSQLAYPGDPSAPAEEIVNCLCSLVPVVVE